MTAPLQSYPRPLKLHRAHAAMNEARQDDTDFRVVWCDACGSEGRVLTQFGNDPDSERDHGPCPWCDGTGRAIIPVEPITLDDLLCADGCQYAKDVAMPEYSCANGCQYARAKEASDVENT